MKDNSGVQETCPLINKVIEIIRDSYSGETPIDKHDLDYAESLLEDIRTANGALRQFGIDKCEEVENRESDVTYWERECEMLKDQIEDLNKQIKQFEDG